VAGSAVAGQLKVDDGWHRVIVRRRDTQEVARLLVASRAQREEVVGAPVQPGRLRAVPVCCEPLVYPALPLRGLDVGELDSILGDLLPFDLTLVRRHVDAVAFAVCQRRPPVRDENEPEDRGKSHQQGTGGYRGNDEAPPPHGRLLMAAIVRTTGGWANLPAQSDQQARPSQRSANITATNWPPP
jgi:hypothetical protein